MLVRPPREAPLVEIVLRLWPLTLWPLVLCVPLVVCGLVLEEGAGGGGIFAPDEVRPTPLPVWVREGSDALEFREDVTGSQRDDNANHCPRARVATKA